MLLPRRCVRCKVLGSPLCTSCRSLLPPSSGGAFPAPFSYEGAGREVLSALKFRDARAVVALLASAMCPLVPQGVEVVTWAPTSAARRRARGFDQAELLARAVARNLGLPCRRLLVREGHAPPQTGRSRVQRLEGPSFRALRPLRQRVLVVDDVVTTGSTLGRAVEALQAAGAPVVMAVAAATTPAARHRSAWSLGPGQRGLTNVPRVGSPTGSGAVPTTDGRRMDISVSSRNAEVSASVRAAAIEKIGRLSRFLDGLERAEVLFSEEQNRRISAREVCEVAIYGQGHSVRARVAAADQFGAIDLAVEKLEQQLHRLKTKVLARQQGKGHRVAV